MTLISRILGLVRDIVIARFFAVGGATDAFFVAFKIPNFFRRLFAEGAFSQAFVPVLSEYREKRGTEAVRALIERTAGTLGLILLAISALGMLLAPLLVMVFAPGFIDEPTTYDLTTQLLRITFPYILFISLVALAGGVLNTYGRFGVPAFTPVFLNLSLIAAAIWVAPQMDEPVTALAWGVLIAGVAQLAFQLPFLARLGLLPRPRWGARDEGVRRIMILMLPALFAVSVVQINLLLDTVIASFLAPGSVSWLYYSDRLVEFPMGVFGIALATVILPSLSQNHAQSDPNAFARTLDWGLRWVMVIGVPATLGLLFLSGPLLATLFQYGEFGTWDLQMARLSLMAYSVGLLGFILVKVLVPGFFARQDTRTPVRVAVIAMLANLVLNVAFVLPMQWWDIPGAHAGLALATSLASFINAGLLFHLLRKQGVFRAAPGWGRLSLQISAGVAAMSLLLIFGLQDLAQWSQWSSGTRAAWLLFWVAAGMAVYAGVLLLTGLKSRDVLINPEKK
ncbi:MAG: murein biosynthesis integral membrane protein MurJ [Pseudomonadota bacterium]